MTIPRNKRRTIIVNGIKWEYCISNFVSIYLKNLLTKEQYSWYLEVKPKWGTQFTPKDVEELITEKSLDGIDWKKI
jgi:hypothetical protein